MGIYIGKQDKLVEGIISSDAFKSLATQKDLESLATKEELNSLKEELLGKKVFNEKLDDEINQLFDSIVKSSEEQAEDIEGLRSLKNEFVDSYKTSNPEVVNQELERIKTNLESALDEIKTEETALNQESHEKKDKDAKKNELDKKKENFNSSLKGFETSLGEYITATLERVYKYHIAYKTMLYEWEDKGMFASSNGGYIQIKDLFSTVGINGLKVLGLIA